MDTRAGKLLCNIPGCLDDADVQWRDKRTGAENTISGPKAIELYRCITVSWVGLTFLTRE